MTTYDSRMDISDVDRGEEGIVLCADTALLSLRCGQLTGRNEHIIY